MPADRVTSYSPWHVVLILDDSNSMNGEPIEIVNTAVRGMIEEMVLLSGGMKPYFRLSIVKFGTTAELLCEYVSERDVDLAKVAALEGKSGATNAAAALDIAREVLERHPGKDSDFEPFVFFFSDGAPFDGTSDTASRAAAIRSGERLKQLKLHSGEVRLITVGFGKVDHAFMGDLASKRGGEPRYKPLNNVKQLFDWFPDIGTIAASQSAPSGTSAAQAVEDRIMNL